MMKWILSAALAAGFVLVLSPVDAQAKRHERGGGSWSKYQTALLCDRGNTTVLVHNQSATDAQVDTRVSDAGGVAGTGSETVLALGDTSFDCASLALSSLGTLALASNAPLSVTVIHETAAGLVVDRVGGDRMGGREHDQFDDDGDDDSGDDDSSDDS
jgi:hypothetical protein